MDTLNNYSFKGYNFSLWLFRILMFMILTVAVLLVVLRINESITIQEGEIISATPQSDYKAPFDGQLLKIMVKEGQQVKAGDTLLVMENPDYKEQMAKARTEIEYLEKKINSIGVLQVAIQRRRAAIDQTTAIASQKYKLDVNRLVTDMKMLDEQYNLQQQRLSAANEKYMGDSILYKKDMLSKYELNATKDANLNLKENLTTLQAQRHKQQSEKSLVYNNFTKEQNDLLLTKVQLDENAQSLIQAKSDLEGQLIQARETLAKLTGELNKFNVIATNNGIVNFLFNTKQQSSIITKGELLVSVAPQSSAYYAKVVIPEKDLPHIRAGLNAKLKTDAYTNFQHGGIEGRVSYISDRKETEKFYALVEFTEKPKFQLRSGYAIYGEIIVDRLPLYKYFIKKLFKKFDK
jgi:hemolysin D